MTTLLAERTPQREPRRAANLFRAQALPAYSKADAARVMTLMQNELASSHDTRPTPLDLEAHIAKYVGWNYGFRDRCGGSYHEFDCSGLMCKGMSEIGVGIGCISSFVIAQMCTDAGLEVTYDDLYNGMLGWAFRGGDHGRRSNGTRNGADGHIVYVNMRPGGNFPPGTIEARGRAYGVVRGTFSRTRQFTGFYKIIGLSYAPPQLQEIDMFVVQHHYSPLGVIAGWIKPIIGHENETPVVRVANDGSCIEAWWGATIVNDQPVDQTHPLVVRRWTSPARPLASGTKFTGVAFTGADNLDPHPGGVATVSDGTTRRFHLS